MQITQNALRPEIAVAFKNADKAVLTSGQIQGLVV
jgi:hypothetical protein